MLKRILSILTATLALSAETLCAYMHPNYEKGECWEVGAEYLYWLPDIDNTIFVAESIPVGGIIGPLVGNSFGFHSGFRVEGAYALDCTSDLQIRYARLRCSTNKTVTGTNLWQIGMFNGLTDYDGFATSDLDFYYQNVELLYTNRIWDNACSHFYVLGGLQYYYFSFSEDLFYADPGLGFSNYLDRSCHNYGIGPEFGFEFVCPLNLGWCGLENMNIAIVGQASGSLLAHHTHLEFANDIMPYDVDAQKIWRVIPALNARAGLQYASTCWCVDFDIEIGYEFNSYFRSLEKEEIVSGAATFESRFYNVDMQGLYVAVGLNF